MRIDAKTGVINDAKYRTDGCLGALTSASALTELAKGRSIEDTLKFNVTDVVRSLKDETGGLPKHMWDCCAMAVESLREAIERYKRKKQEAKR